MISGHHAPDFRSRLIRPWMILCAVTACFFVSGCSLLSFSSLFSDAETTGKSELRLPRIVASRDSVQLEILFVDRPANDALLGDSLWKQVDQIAGMPAGVRDTLRENGWRVGHASSHPPRALEQLLEMSSERPEVNDNERRLVGRRVALAAGGNLPIDLTELQPELRLKPTADGETKSYSNVKCILNVQIDREQDGWVRLNFTPEVHHGQNWLRPVATQLDWTRRRGQLVEPLFDQKFSLSLNVGEMAVITAEGDDKESAGHSFFRSVHESGGLQRLLVVRVANMRKMVPVYDN
ncbi:MAG: hypothetical protein ACKVHE_06600 [Planctomycetales bacterium]|jgi:hypothetical protein